ncbi:MAG: hypothetical protein ACO1QB_12850, partial [Verrucomicrobiales bacterium]
FSLVAQEAQKVVSSPEAEKTVSSAAEALPEHASSESASHATSNGGEDASPVHPSASPSGTPSVTDPTPSLSSTPEAASSPESSSSIVPTDPSMIPPPQPVPPNPEDKSPSVAPSAEVTSSSEASMPSTESIEKKKQELKVRYYEVRTQVEKEEDVASLKQKADQATTDEGKRQALRAYYELLFSKMKKVDPSISARCDLMQGAYLRRLEQTTLQPSIPLTPSTKASGDQH